MFWFIVTAALFAGGLLASRPGLAALSISVCGSSTYDCQNPLGPETILGSQHVGTSAQVNAICDASGKCAYVGGQPSTAAYTPSGWASPSSPPATRPRVIVYTSSGNSGVGITAVEACQDWVNKENANPGGHPAERYPFVYNRIQSNQCFYRGADYPSSSEGSIAQSIDCPAGYTDNGTACALSNAAVVQKPLDGKCNVIRTGNTYSGDANDPDCSLGSAGGAAQALNLNVSSNQVTASAPGQTATVNTNTGTGATTITNSTANTNNTTTNNIVNLGAPPGGTGAPAITGKGVSTTEGVGDMNDPDKRPEGACGSPGQPKCAIDESGTPTDGSLASANEAWEAARAAHLSEIGKGSTTNKVADLGITFGIELPSVACTNPSFVMPGGHVLTVGMCERRPDINAALSWLAFALTAVYLFRLIYQIG